MISGTRSCGRRSAATGPTRSKSFSNGRPSPSSGCTSGTGSSRRGSPASKPRARAAKEMESVLRQTLLLAQRTADETVTAAHERARHLVEESEDRALTLTSEAEEQARIVGEAQRQKYEAIVSELSARRDLLTLDIDALERVQADYRGRLRADPREGARRARPAGRRCRRRSGPSSTRSTCRRAVRRAWRRSGSSDLTPASRPPTPSAAGFGRPTGVDRRRAAHRGAGGARRGTGRFGPVRSERPPSCLTGLPVEASGDHTAG